MNPEEEATALAMTTGLPAEWLQVTIIIIITTMAAGRASPAGIDPLTLAAHGEQGPGLTALDAGGS